MDWCELPDAASEAVAGPGLRNIHSMDMIVPEGIQWVVVSIRIDMNSCVFAVPTWL